MVKLTKYESINARRTKEERFEVALTGEDLKKIDQMIKLAISLSSKANGIFSGKLVERYLMKYHGIKEARFEINEKLDMMIEQDIQRIRKEATDKSQQS